MWRESTDDLVQICHAYKDIGGTTIVILTETPKLEIQAWFRCVLDFTRCMLPFAHAAAASAECLWI